MAAPSSKYLIDEVLKRVRDVSFSRKADILPAMNKALRTLARDHPFPALFVTEPQELTCPADSISASLPSDFSHHLVHAYNSTNTLYGGRVKIWRSFAHFKQRFNDFDHSSPVRHVCPVGNRIWYQGVPASDETLKVMYTTPPVLYDSDLAANVEVGGVVTQRAVIDWIPEDYQEELIVNFAAAELWDIREQGVDGSKVNYNKYISRYDLAVEKLETVLFDIKVDEGPDFVPNTMWSGLEGDPDYELI